jgi:hypothetical protein
MTRSIKSHVTELYEKHMTPISIILYIVFALPVIFVGQIPDKYKKYGSNIFVRILLFGLIVLTAKYISYIHALLFAMFVVLYVSFAPGIIENFQSQTKKKVIPKTLWWDEQVFKTVETEVDEITADTQAVQS